MPRPRRTISLEDLTTTVNMMLENSIPEYVKQRQALAVLLGTVLMDANAYNGFNYLPTEFASPGVLRQDYDDSRRRYYMPKR